MADETKADVMMVTEPNKKNIQKGGWYVDRTLDAAIRVRNREHKVDSFGSGKGFVWAEMRGCRMISGYVSPNASYEEFQAFLEDLRSCIRNSSTEVLLAGDFNSKSPTWGSRTEDRRGRALAELLAECDLVVQNQGEEATFVGGRGESVIDITCASTGLAQKISGWRVNDNVTLSDHRPITFQIGAREQGEAPRTNSTGWWWQEDKKESLLSEVKRQLEALLDLNPKSLVEAIQRACNLTLRRKFSDGRRPVYWWTAEVAGSRRTCLCARRQLTRAMKKKELGEIHSAQKGYKEASKNLKLEIKRSKEAAWTRLVEEVEENPWGDGYKIATGKIRRDIPPSTTETWDAVRKLFPQGRPPVWTSPREEEVPAFTVEELQAAAKRLRPKKAPGPDGIPPEVVKNLVDEVPEVILEVMNDCLRTRTFPRTWKVARLVLLPKGKPGTEKRKFRPICLLDTLGKLLEHLIRARLANNLEEKGGLSDAQFGFREGLSTVDAFEEVMKVARFANAGTWGRKDYCALVLIDVENAFNSAPWARVVEAMERRTLDAYLIGLIQSYLTERGLVVTDRERVDVVCGVPQGSVLGPVLWNIMYDGVLSLEVPVGVRLVAFADDLAIVGTARTEESLVDCVDRALSMVAEWMKRTGLRLATQKTEAVLLVGRRRPRKVKFTVGGEEIQPKESVRYLGVRVDQSMTFIPHLEEVAVKAERMVASLSRIMPNLKGASSSRRRLLSAVVHSRLLYGAAGWADALKQKRSVEILNRVQRRALIRIVSAYRSVSTEALQVITGVLPVDIQAEGRALLRRQCITRDQLKERQLQKWQTRWETTEKGSWTRQLLPRIAEWTGRNHGELEYHITQALTGHGCFAAFLNKIGKENSPKCWYCDAEVDDVEHTLFRCERWDYERLQVMRETTEWPTKENFVAILLRSKEDWEVIVKYVSKILKAKEDTERQRERTVR
jgi:hypothetical protein